ncbi:PPOX class F420-dependent oxidoreductase [Streptomyces sp. NBC_01465]|uniref:PPOX class F420-dependent oxidoreductase n=1 Tax=Streptomyces sp. NBC_01465 TaxID=2903878 RepID=UPI002E354BAB|nr:PPOX class F420-dependent oxidoreductase [Streptomyces sp. NBC_01465]
MSANVELTDAQRKFLDGAQLAVLVTLNADGSPQSSPVWVGLDGDELVVSTQAGRRKDRNLRRDPRVSLTVVDPSDPERYTEVRGTATVAEDVGRAVAASLGEKYHGEGGGQTYLDLPPEVVRVVIRITPQHVAGRI